MRISRGEGPREIILLARLGPEAALRLLADALLAPPPGFRVLSLEAGRRSALAGPRGGARLDLSLVWEWLTPIPYPTAADTLAEWTGPRFARAEPPEGD